MYIENTDIALMLQIILTIIQAIIWGYFLIIFCIKNQQRKTLIYAKTILYYSSRLLSILSRNIGTILNIYSVSNIKIFQKFDLFISQVFGKALPSLFIFTSITYPLYLMRNPMKAKKHQWTSNFCGTVLIVLEFCIFLTAVITDIPQWVSTSFDYINTVIILITMLFYLFTVNGQITKMQTQQNNNNIRNSVRVIQFMFVFYLVSSIADIFSQAYFNYLEFFEINTISVVQTVIFQYLYQILYDLLRAALFVPPKQVFQSLHEVEAPNDSIVESYN
ncbi:Hypothetical_protein [Hexamita inflata]|uniref:Hypothetical_protein n=1 Tax=Hexamita inflata TaxID=28002 RepID=A0AA86Q0M1_9EUKA|nr:Hypothetical protein HINF_LOCUS37475 [Hexamita inflata]CAI9974553.1 Hypothetical protein HINF_LOCUS62198 [Hexamita inflata]